MALTLVVNDDSQVVIPPELFPPLKTQLTRPATTPQISGPSSAFLVNECLRSKSCQICCSGWLVSSRSAMANSFAMYRLQPRSRACRIKPKLLMTVQTKAFSWFIYLPGQRHFYIGCSIQNCYHNRVSNSQEQSSNSPTRYTLTAAIWHVNLSTHAYSQCANFFWG